MLVSPADHFRLHEQVATTSKEVRQFIDSVDEAGESTGCDVYWRGQADHTWGIRSSLSRLTDTPTALKDSDLNTAESQLLTEAQQWVTAYQAQPTSALEWLALLQHHWVPTRMLDFTPEPLTATFFAVEKMDEVEGRLFAILIPREGGTLRDEDAEDFRISQMRSGEIQLWKPRPQISPRLAAQNGVFAVGKLPSTNIARHTWDETLSRERLMVRSEIVSVMSLPFYFQKLGTQPRAGANGTRAFTLKIHVDKSSVREQLAKRGNHGALRPTGDAIDQAFCYPDVDGMAKFSRVLKRIERGVN